MGLDELSQEIASKAREEAERIGSSADSKAAEISRNAKSEREKLLKSIEDEVRSIAEGEKSERLAAARLQSKKVVSEAREELCRKVTEQVAAELGAIASGKKYKSFLVRAISDAAKQVGSGAVVSVNKRDSAIAKEAKGVKLGEPINCIGGAIVSSADGTVRVNATFESMLEEKSEEIRRQVFRELFGGAKAR